MRFGREVCSDWAAATAREWLETNGLGSYASGTVAGAHTRRYHGLLVAALRPPTARTLLLSKLEETLVVGDDEYDLSANQYPGAIHPQGYRHLTEFRLDPFPTFRYEVAGGAVCLEKHIAMCRGRNLVVVEYRILAAPGSVSLVVRPLLNCRDYHHLMRENDQFDTTVRVSGARDLTIMQPYPGVPPLHLQFAGAYFEEWGDWYRNFEYGQEAARGPDYHEDQCSPGFFTCTLEAGETRHIIASIEPFDDFEPRKALGDEAARRQQLTRTWSDSPPEIRSLVSASDAFLVGPGHHDKEDGGIIAGYHWFEEWGRDTMISLPGLTLVTGRPEVARSILHSYARYQRDGLIPNRIPSLDEEPHYNTVDATLWLFWAVQKYVEYTGDREFLDRELLPVLLKAIERYARGTRHDIGMDPADGLLRAGNPTTQLTWMDAKVGDWVVTPRYGKPVEINALWYNALCFVEQLGAAQAGPSPDQVRESFARRFWNEEFGFLNDVVDGDLSYDASLRPNQVLAASLPYPVLDAARARRMLAAVKRELLTPYGLRTLSPHDSRYQGRYVGDQRSRDGAYHQGTVWPWLLGPFITAYVGTAEDRAAAQQEARRWLEPCWRHLREAGLGYVSEIFDGDAPHFAKGCIAQAWSVAEILRAAIEDLGLAPTLT
ncbi:MAG: glycogen debranching enzyme family protein [Armatimonadetes bacterium]|nr:glycogen debranching enzyme family protein [Armatimonadota bacterium]